MKKLIEIRNMASRVIYGSWALSIRECLENGVKDNADLRRANLEGFDLKGAYLEEALLEGAYLQGSNLQGAYLQESYLQGADLRGTNLEGSDLDGAHLEETLLQGANLQGANLRSISLRGSDLDGAWIGEKIRVRKQPIQIVTHTYCVTIWDNHMHIGCEFHTIKDWWSFNARIIDSMDEDASEWWAKWKEPLKLICAGECRGVEKSK